MKSLLVAILIGLTLSAAWAAEKGEPLPAFADTCFQFRPAGSFVPMADVERLLATAGSESRMFVVDRDKVRMRGLFRFRDWTPEDTVRLEMAESGNPLRVHVWGEGQGLSLVLTHAGAVYHISQQPSEAWTRLEPRARVGWLVATDDRRGSRLPAGPFQIRCQEKAIVITKGDVVIMRANMEGPAKALYLELPNDTTLHDLALFRSGPPPETCAYPHRLVLDGTHPSQLSWKEPRSAGTRFERLPDGGVELSAENTTEVAMATMAVAEPGLVEIIARIDDATAGAGLVLLNFKGEPLEGIEFALEAGQKRLAFGLGNPREQPWLGNFDFNNRPVPWAGKGLWFRLIVAGGTSKFWISDDGLHWSRLPDAHDRYGAWQSIALYVRETGDRKRPEYVARRIRLRSLQVRELSGLTAAAPAALLKAAAGVKMNQNESPQAWWQRIAPLAPAGCAPSAWRYACTLQALAAAVSSDAAQAILQRSLRERLGDLRSTRAKIDLLQDAALVGRPRQDATQQQLELWERLGREVVNADGPDDFDLYRRALMQASLGDPPERSGPINWELARDALILFHDAHCDAGLAQMQHVVMFWRGCDQQVGGWPTGQQLDRLLQWMNVRPSGRRVRRRSEVTEVPRVVTPPLNRAASNTLSELKSALDGKQYADAARVVITCDPPTDSGLVAAPHDDQLFLSFRTVLRLRMLEDRGLREAMAGQIGPADQLKIEQILARGDPAAIVALPLQYCGTSSAVVPCQWLGDRALAAADFAQAASWYDEGLQWASPEQQSDLAARKRLVAAMLGSAQGQPPDRPVSFEGVKVSPEQFETWIREQLARQQVASGARATEEALPVVAAAQPLRFQATTFGQLNDAAGRGYKGDDLPWEFREVDWTWRHLAAVSCEDSLLAVQRGRIAAFGMADGKLRWNVHLGNGWSSSPVRPLVLGRRIYIRANVGPDHLGLACLDGRTGGRAWLCDCGGTAASDPLWYRGRLFVVTIGPAGSQFVSPLCLAELHPETGEVLSRQQIVEATEREKLPSDCQACWAGNRLVVLLAGTVLCADLQGRIVWLRQSTSLPSAVDPAFVHQQCQPAIGSKGSLLLHQPGSCVIDCLGMETGQIRWRRGLIGLQRVFDLPDDRLLARTTRGLVALNKTTGEVLWQRDFPGLLAALAQSASGLILGARQAMLADKPSLVFLWIDPATGQTFAHGPAPLEKNQPVFLGPFATHGDRIWCCFGYGASNDSPKAENHKRIIELRPGSPAIADEVP
jgi:outer membrane protein assembly factor BamB